MAESQDPTRAASLARLERELDRRLQRMQSPQQQKAVDRLFELGSDELGQAALDAARVQG